MSIKPDWKFQETRLILCEGPDDKNFLECLIGEHKLPPFKVMHTYEASGGKYPGKDGFKPSLKGFKAQTKFGEMAGIAIITDNDKANTRKKIEKELTKIGYATVPSESECLGTINGVPIILILIPEKNIMGNLEMFCLPSLCDEWPNSVKCVDEYLECTGAIAWKKQQELPKAKARSLISGNFEEDPNRGLGYLFRNKKHLVHHPCFSGLVETLRHFDKIVASCVHSATP